MRTWGSITHVFKCCGPGESLQIKGFLTRLFSFGGSVREREGCDIS